MGNRACPFKVSFCVSNKPLITTKWDLNKNPVVKFFFKKVVLSPVEKENKQGFLKPYLMLGAPSFDSFQNMLSAKNWRAFL